MTVFKVFQSFSFFYSIDTQYVLLYPFTTAKVYRSFFSFKFIDKTKTVVIPDLIPTLNLPPKSVPSSNYVFIFYLQVTLGKKDGKKIKEKKLSCIIQIFHYDTVTNTQIKKT